ncbi:GRAM domain-containing protein 2B isoform X1 [Gadus morhua]|uniref:GRAM domain-containing protein 2B-like n=1 Tax=Gadus morhua TaxID=8049 RepID=A0A8C5A640_GADMO|nr:GRAM domain-containing protein 2B-like isoform X1 [Gadus morhua]
MEKVFMDVMDGSSPRRRRYTVSRSSCLSSPPQARRPSHHGCDANAVCEQRQRKGGSERTHLDLDHSQPPGRRKPHLVRSKTFDHSLLNHLPPDTGAKVEQKKPHYSQLSKTNSQYHKVFKDICKEELLRQSYTCALQKDILYQGRLFVSDNWICFQSKVFGKDTKIAIPVVFVTNIKKTKTAILVPNALEISTSRDRYVFVSFLSRDNTYKFLMSVCLHLEEKSPCGSPFPSADSNFRVQRSIPSPHFPLGFPADFSELGVMRDDLEESSSSDSPTQEMAEYPVPTLLEVLKHPDEQVPLDRTTQEIPVLQVDDMCSGSCKVKERAMTPPTSPKSVSINTLLFIYLLLVCVLVVSSCYMAYRIFSLEHTLTSMSDLSKYQNEFQGGPAEVHTELYSELTLSLMKLETVCLPVCLPTCIIMPWHSGDLTG